MLCSYFVLSFDACIVTMTWSLMFVITLAPCSSSALSTLMWFLVFYQLTRNHLALLMNVVSGFKSLSEAPHLARNCGTHRSDSPVRAL
jgi:hypothetical protein